MNHLRLTLLVAFAAMLAALASPAAAQRAAGENVALATHVRQALDALKLGQFDRTSELLKQAASDAADPNVEKMVSWARQFQEQRLIFVTERKKEFDKACEEVHTLVANGKETYALDSASRAYILADDKKAFRNEKWVDTLVRDSIRLAAHYESQEQWLKAMRLYTDLGFIEPANPEWKDKFKTAARRVRLLATYAPAAVRALQESESRDREDIERLLRPATRPATKPTTEETEFKSDWRDGMRGVRADMLKDGLGAAVSAYWREVNYKQLAVAGLRGIETVLTTKGMEKAFPGLDDAAKRQDMLKFVNDNILRVTAADEFDETRMDRLLDSITRQNDDTVELPAEVLISEFADRAFAELDPFSNIMWPAEWEEFQKGTKGEFSGVGIQIDSNEEGDLRVVSPIEDSPALKAGIRPGDIITHINAKKARGITLSQAVKQITGAPRTKVTLTVKSLDGTLRDYELERNIIKVQSIKGWTHKPAPVGGWDYFIDPVEKIGYVRLTSFSETTADDLTRALSEMTDGGLRGLILDVRFNPGGLLKAATDVAEKFLPPGKLLVSTRPDRPNMQRDVVEIKSQFNRNKIDVPMVVLVNQYSASASEIVSGALKDHKRAILVGERTFGKGSVQMLFGLGGNKPAPASLRLTTSHYYLPSNRCIHREENSTEWGVDPEVTVEMTPEQMRAAIDLRQEQDVLRNGREAPTTQPRRDPLEADAQLSTALFLMRLQLAGNQIAGVPQNDAIGQAK